MVSKWPLSGPLISPVQASLSQVEPRPPRNPPILSQSEDVNSIYGFKPIYNTFYIHVHSICVAQLSEELLCLAD